MATIEGTAARDEALALLDRGFALLPVMAQRKEPNTRVLRRVHNLSGWAPLKDRLASRPEVAAWFDVDPTTNVGIITGQPSGVAVRDYDDGLPAHLPATPVVVSPGRGGHAYFRISGPVKTRKLADGELRGDGGYVVAPPSVHPNGGAYAWVASRDLSVPFAPLDLDDPAVTCTSTSTTCNPVAPRHPYIGALVQGGVGPATRLLEWCKNEEWVERAAEVMGVRYGRNFRCVLPGHQETRPSANLWRDHEGVHKYRCHHPGGPGAVILPDLYATVISRRWRERRGPELARWGQRLLHATGDLELGAFDPPRLLDASEDAQRALDGFVLLLRVRWAAGDFDPAPFTRRFGSEWCVMPERRFEAAKGELLRRRVLVKAGEVGSGYAQPTSTYVLAA